jgi:hypothetical protein
MSQDNVGWGAPRIHGELQMLGIQVSQATVAKYMLRHRKPPSQNWKTFLNSHTKDLVSIDFFTVPTATFRILYVFLVLQHERRQITHFNCTEHPTSQWTAQQIIEAFPWDSAPRYLLRDRDKENPYVERLIGSIRRECLNHVIIFNEHHLKRLLRAYLSYYHSARTHLSLDKQCPKPRTVDPPENGKVIAFPHLGGLHHEYRRAA